MGSCGAVNEARDPGGPRNCAFRVTNYRWRIVLFPCQRLYMQCVREPLFFCGGFDCGSCSSRLHRSVFCGTEASNACFRGEIAADSTLAGPVRQILDTFLPCHDKCGWAIIKFEKPRSSASRCTFLSSPRQQTLSWPNTRFTIRNGYSTLAFAVSARAAAPPASGIRKSKTLRRDTSRCAHFPVPRHPAPGRDVGGRSL